MQARRVVVTGLGALTPLGLDVASYWQSLVNGVSGADYIKGFDAEKFRTRFACELKGFQADNYIDQKDGSFLSIFYRCGRPGYG